MPLFLSKFSKKRQLFGNYLKYFYLIYCYHFDFRYNINFFEVLEATNDDTNEIFNLIGHGVDIVNMIGGDINKREEWVWQEGRCKEDDWN